MEACIRWWVRHCLKSQARKTSPQPVRGPIPLLPLRNRPAIFSSLDSFQPLGVTASGKSLILLFIDCFSRGSNMYAVTITECIAEGKAVSLLTYTSVHLYVGLLRLSFLAEDGSGFVTNLAHAVYTL